MTKKEFQDYMKIVFDNLENAECYYWNYLNQAIQFELIAKLAYSNNLISESVYSESINWVKDVKKRYGE